MACTEGEQNQIEKIKAHFESDLADYDYCAARVVPANIEVQKQLVQTIPCDRQANLKMLDLGVGTGQTSLMVLEAFPNAAIDGIDISASMLKVAEKRLAKYSARIRLFEGDFCSLPFEEKYDVIFSAVAIHNVCNEEKQKLFKKIFDSLKPFGYFVNADFIAFKSSYLNKIAKDNYVNYLRKNISGNELKHWLHHATEEDQPATLDDQTQWLKETGFQYSAPAWIHENLAVYYAVK